MQTIYLDISNKGVIPTVYAKQGDIGRKIFVVLTDNGVPYPLSENHIISAWYSGDSGDGNYSNIGEESAFEISGNKITVELIYQMLSVSGSGELTIVINNSDGDQIGLWSIPYIAEKWSGSESEEANNYYSAFVDAAVRAEAAALRAEQVLKEKTSVQIIIWEDDD